MTRSLRIEFAGGLYHVTSRGDRLEAIYLRDTDRHAWLDVFAQVCERFNWVCHGWCQMTNHYHLIIEMVEANLSQGMRQLNGVYTQYVNRRYKRVGHVFQGGYKAILVEKEGYLLELSRYVVLNPVRAGMVPDVAVVRWRDFVRAGVGQPPLWDALRGQIYLGSDTFVEKMQPFSNSVSQLTEIPRTQRRPVAKPLANYKQMTAPAAAAMAAAYASGNYTMQAIATVFGVHYATVSRAVKQCSQQHTSEIYECKT